MASEISQMSDSSIVIIQGTVGLYTVATRCHTCFAVTLKYTEDSSLTILQHSLVGACVVGGACMAWGCVAGHARPPRGYDEIRSMSGRHASYWNAFLFKIQIQ